MINQSCPSCGTVLAIPSPLTGKKWRCPKCNHISTASVSAEATLKTRNEPSSPLAEKDTLPPSDPPQTPSDPPATRDRPPETAVSRSGSLSWTGRDGPQLPGDIPGYEVLAELGRGGMGVVYKAHQKSLKRLVALKMILGGAQAGGQEFARFQAEAEALARLRHPNIVQVHEVSEYQGQPYFSLEFLEGGSLNRKLQGNPLPPR